MSALDRLADACGIEPFYFDVEGVRHDRSPETARAILAAMGRRAENETVASESLKALEAERRERFLPPVAVVREGEAVAIPVGTQGRVLWRLEEDSGTVREGACRIGHHDLRQLLLPGPLPTGHHRLHVACGAREAALPLIVAPGRCFLPDAFHAGARPWGLAVQLYALRGERHQGIGDFGDLARLGHRAAKAGAATIGINPLHALAPLDPGTASPYFPSSRCFLEPLYLDIPALPEFRRSAAARRLAGEQETCIAALRAADETDHSGVAALKARLLEAMFRDFRDRRDEAEQTAFAAFRECGGRRLEAFSTWQALAAHFGTPQWRDWPSAYHDPAAPAVARFAREAAGQVAFRAFVQWLCARQLAGTRAAMKAEGLVLGLYGDMALGVDPAGADAWLDGPVYASTAQLGAPPDDFNIDGQAWGVAAPLPEAMRRKGHAPFIAALHANMAHMDMLRLDHVMALERAFWVPAGMSPRDGAYVRYPLEEILGIVALESRRAATVVVGEDLGTVEPALRARLEAADILSTRVLCFEKDDHRFRPPEAWPRRAVASTVTHDLPPLDGYWQGRDLALRRALGLFADDALAERLLQRRATDREGLLRALAAAGLPVADPDDPAALRRAVHRFLARTASWLAMLQLDDLCGETEPVNLPGTLTHYPNWRRKTRRTLESLIDDPALAREFKAFAAARKR